MTNGWIHYYNNCRLFFCWSTHHCLSLLISCGRWILHFLERSNNKLKHIFGGKRATFCWIVWLLMRTYSHWRICSRLFPRSAQLSSGNVAHCTQCMHRKKDIMSHCTACSTLCTRGIIGHVGWWCNHHTVSRIVMLKAFRQKHCVG